MKPFFLTISLSSYLLAAAPEHAAESHLETAPSAVSAVTLDAAAVANLGIQTEIAAFTPFDDVSPALGRIERISARHAVVASRIPGRIVALTAHEGDLVAVGQSLAKVESRQPGAPPPVVDLPSPISGMVTASNLRLGEPVEPDRNLMEITDLGDVWAVARVPDHLAARLHSGSEARISIAATAGLPVTGKMLRFGTSADPLSGTIDAIFQLPNDGLRLRPGMRAEFEILLERRENVLSIPRDAVQGGPSNRHVFVQSPDLPNTYLRTLVRTGSSSGNRVEILSGLTSGNLVVTTGSYPLGFVSGGNTSIKEALDAVHGHEHSEDGTCASSAAKGSVPTAHDHAEEAPVHSEDAAPAHGETGHEHSKDGTCTSSTEKGAAPAEHEHDHEEVVEPAESEKSDHSSHNHP